MQSELKAQFEKEAPNIEEITAKIVKERVDYERKKFDYERE